MNRNHRIKILITACVILFSGLIFSQTKTFTIKGYVTDYATGETMIGANIIHGENPNTGTATNTYGFYSFQVQGGTVTILASYLGYQPMAYKLDLNRDTTINFKLKEGILVDEVIISAEREEARKNVESTQMGLVALPMESIKKLPVLFGEVDVLKTLQLLPGVLAGGEGTSGFVVRGGGPDQNLLLLDEAVVYNSGHLLGFFSVFNGDAIKNTTLIKGGMPANYGGRLSSVVDVQMKEGNNKKYAVQGGVGIISSRLTLEGPIVEDKSSFIISGRRTYALDLAKPAIDNTDFAGTNYYFYDLNTKINYKFSDKDRVYFSGYFGRDVLTFNQPKRDFKFSLPYGNSTATLRWNHLFSNKLFMNVSAIYNDYQFEFNGGQDQFTFKVFSGVRDYNAKVDFDYFLNNKNHIRFGMNYTSHKLTPNTASAQSDDVDFSNNLNPKYGQDIGIYALDDIKVSNRLGLNVGGRFSLFSQVGPYNPSDGRKYSRFEPVVTFPRFEPRTSFNYILERNSSIKGGVTVSNQFLHLVTNSASTLPADVWVPSTENVKPQSSIQYALGYFKNFKNDTYETSFEVYYRDLKNQIDYADDYVNDISQDIEKAFVFGKGRAYGTEFFIKKAKGKLNGWIGYTLSRTERSFDKIENGRWYPAVYDRTHNLTVVTNYQLSRKWDVGGVFIYGSGRLFTPTNGFFFIEQNLNLFFGPRNSQRLPDYHRMDISFNYTPRPDSKKKWKGEWNFSVYNVYNRKNPFFINFETNSDFQTGITTIEGSKITIFPIIPSITYNFKWNQ
jgi:hypothetical protein